MASNSNEHHSYAPPENWMPSTTIKSGAPPDLDDDGKPVIDMTDLQMLALEDGKDVEGLDIRPQDYFEHLRWKEKPFLETRQATNGGAPQ